MGRSRPSRRCADAIENLLAALQALMTAAEIDPETVFDCEPDFPVYEGAEWFTRGLVDQIRAAIAKAI